MSLLPPVTGADWVREKNKRDAYQDRRGNPFPRIETLDALLAAAGVDIDALQVLMDRVPKAQIPGSVVVGSGSASVDVHGLITFTGVSSLSLNGVFDGLDGDQYAVYLYALTSAGATLSTRMRAAGSDQAGTNYVYTVISTTFSTSPVRNSATGTAQFGWWIPTTAGTGCAAQGVMHLWNPGRASTATFMELFSHANPNGDRTVWLEGANGSSSACDGISFILSAGTMSGYARVVKVA